MMKKQILEEKKEYLEQLFDLLKIPSISADPKYNEAVKKTANWIEGALKKIGCNNVEVFDTAGHPIVYGEKFINANAPTVLVYGHYDVQPPDPLELWENDPFEPSIKKTQLHPNGAIYARGACDDKGQMFMHIKAVELLIKNKLLKCNVKFIIEGEEEIGSVHLEGFINNHKKKLKSDIIIISLL